MTTVIAKPSMPWFITENESCWDFLRRTELPIFIYGMGDGALKILSVFERCGIAAAGFFASDEFVRGHYFEGHLVHKLSDVERELEDFIIVLAFAAGYDSLYSKIRELASRHVLIAPDVPVATDVGVADDLFTPQFVEKNRESIEKVYSLLADDLSRKTYSDVINFKLSGRIDYLHDCTSDRSEVYSSLISLGHNEIYLDLGAYNGDTVLEFIEAAGGSYSEIHAFEPSAKNFKKLSRNLSGIERVRLYNKGAWDKSEAVPFVGGEGRMIKASSAGQATQCVAIDDELRGATVVKLDVEGAERRAILGAKNNICGARAVISALYHRNEDIFDLPLLIHELNPDLKLYIRHHLYIPAWETNLYAVKGK